MEVNLGKAMTQEKEVTANIIDKDFVVVEIDANFHISLNPK